jgi:hypothetical protein
VCSVLIKNVLNKVANVVKNNAEDVGQNVMRKIQDDLVRSPKADCFAATNPTGVLKARIAPMPSKLERNIELFGAALERNEVPKTLAEGIKNALAQTNPNGSPRFSFNDFGIFVQRRGDDINTFGEKLIKLIECKKPDGSYRFNKDELAMLSTLDDKRFSNVEKLLPMKSLKGELLFRLSLNDIEPKKVATLILAARSLGGKLSAHPEELGSMLTRDGIDVEKVLPKLIKKVVRNQNDLKKVVLGKPQMSHGEVNVGYKFANGHSEERLFNSAGKKINYVQSDLKFGKSGEKIYTEKVYDARTNAYSVIRSVDRGEGKFVERETKIIKDKAGNVLRTETLTPSEVEGIYNVKSIDADGNVKIISSGEKDKNGCVTIKKNLEGLDGTKTQYEYYDDPVGNRITYYKIVDKDGKVLLNDTQSFEVVDKNTAISSHGAKSYEIKTDEAGMKIRNLQTKETTQIDFNEFFVPECANSVELKSLLSKVSAEELISLNKKGVKLNYMENSMNSKVCPEGVVDTGANKFAFEHETGHVKDFPDFGQDFGQRLDITNNPVLSKVYDEERDAVLESIPFVQQRYIDYFINKSDHISGVKGALMETVAETNGLLNSYQSSNELAIRTNYLQQYFPKTIAKAAELMGDQA